MMMMIGGWMNVMIGAEMLERGERTRDILHIGKVGGVKRGCLRSSVNSV